MKKVWVLAAALVLVIGIGAVALADQVRIGDLVVRNHINQWPFGLPCVEISIKAVQDVRCPQVPYVNISGYRRAEQLWMYVFIDGNKLLYQQVVRNGVYQVPIPGTYNNHHWNVGWNTLTFVFTSAPRWEFTPNRVLSEAGAWNFLGYPPSGYILVKQVSFNVCRSSPVCFCCNWRCP